MKEWRFLGSSERVFGLDLLRASAIFFVVYGHAGHVLPDGPLKQIYSIPVLDGVTIFFVLSGFLIGRILLRTLERETIDFQTLLNFWVRRWFRTLPNYYLVLLLLLALSTALRDNTPPIPENIVSYFVFAQNIAWPHPEFFGEAWSLAVEEWFYLCVPVPMYIAARYWPHRIRTAILLCISTVIIATICFRVFRVGVFGYESQIAWTYGLRMQVLTRMDSLMLGVLGAYLSLYHQSTWISLDSRKVVSCGIALLIFDHFMRSYSIFYLNYFSLSISSLATLALLPRCSMWRINPGSFSNLITFVSVTSYSMYLVNQSLVLETILPAIMPSVMHLFWRFSNHVDLFEYLLFWILSIGISATLYRFYEVPMTGLRELWPTHKRQSMHAFSASIDSTRR